MKYSQNTNSPLVVQFVFVFKFHFLGQSKVGRGKSFNYCGQDCSLFSIVITPYISPYTVRIWFVQMRGSDRRGRSKGEGVLMHTHFQQICHPCISWLLARVRKCKDASIFFCFLDATVFLIQLLLFQLLRRNSHYCKLASINTVH